MSPSKLAYLIALAVLLGSACDHKSSASGSKGGAGGMATGTGGSAGTSGGGGSGGWPPPGPPYGGCVICGDGLLDPGEECDDGNTAIGDGCNSICQVEANWECTGGRYCVRVSFCGDGIVTSDETCDDHNVSDGDGCSADCQRIEPGWYCPVPGTSCRPIRNPASSVDAAATCDGGELCPPVCGNGIIDAGEECDDGILDGSYGGCTANCSFGPHCGDDMVNSAEECDHGADNGADVGEYSCTVACTKRHFCGDGNADVDLGEECDLGELNGQPRQGCDKDCRHVVLPPNCPL